MKVGLKNGLGLLVLVAACAQNVGDVNRVQPGYTKKAIFDPKYKWYTQETVTRADVATSSYMYEGTQTGGEKIRWMITEEKLLAYRTYETINNETFGGDAAKTIDDKSGLYYGAPFAEYKITSHFDITRDYNPATGEQTNVVNENITDRPWYEREFMRVDWTSNTTPNPMGSLSRTIDDQGKDWELKPTVVAYGDTAYDKANPSRVSVEDDVIRLPARYNVAPEIEYCVTLGNFSDGYQCPPGQVEVLSTYVRIDPAKEYDFQPVYYPDTIPVRDPKGNRVLIDSQGNACDLNSGAVAECSEFRVDVFQRFGYFRTQRLNYDRKAGYLESNRLPLANVWPIWEAYYQRNEDGTFKLDEETQGLVEIPLIERKVRTHILWTDTEWPDYQLETAQKVASAWNTIFKNAIKQAYLAESQRPGTPSATKTKLLELSKSDIPDVFQFSRNNCNVDNVAKYLTDHGSFRVMNGNKVTKLADEATLITGKTADGALNLTYDNLESVCSVLEYYTDTKNHADRQARDKKGALLDKLADGEQFVWQRYGDFRYPMMNWVPRDQVAGPLGLGPSFADPETGMIISAAANIYGAALERYAFSSQQMLEAINDPAGPANILLGQDVAKMVDQVNKASQKRQEHEGVLRPDQKAALQGRFDKIKFRDTKEAIMKGNDASGEVQARLQRLKDSGLEQQLINDDLLDFWSNGRYSREKGTMAADEVAALREKAAPSRWLAAGHANKDRSHVYSTRKNPATGSDLGGCYYPSDGMDEILWTQLKKYQNVKDKNKVWESLSKDIALAVTLHEVGHNMGLRHNFRASADRLNYFDKYWDLQKQGGDPAQNEMMYSSIMDYGASFNSDFSGLGKYDQAAINFAYTGLVQVFDMPNRSKVKYPSVDPSLLPDNDPSSMVDPVQFISVGGCKPTDATGCYGDTGGQTWLMDQHKYDTMFAKDAATSIDNLKNKRKWVKFGDYVDNWRAALSNTDLSKGSVDLQFASDSPSFAVPYAFGSDEFRGSLFSGLPTDVWDHGFTVEQIVSNQIDMYNFRYIFDAFKRGRFGWDPNGYMNRLQGRYFYVLGNAYRYFYYANVFFGDGVDIYDFYKDWGKASLLGIGTLSEAITRPDAGMHCLLPAQSGGGEYVPESQISNCNLNGQKLKTVNIPLGVGRPLYLGWSNDYYYQVTRIGSMYEKAIALMALADTEGTFQRFDNGSFFRFSQIGYYRMFKDDILKFYTGMLTDQSSMIGGKINKKGEFVARPLVLEAATADDLATLKDPTAPSVYPLMHDWNKLIAIMFGSVFMSSTVDSVMDFSNYAHVTVQGSDDDYTSAFPSQLTAQLLNPTNGSIYRAVVNLDLGQVPQEEQSVGYQMLSNAQYTQLFSASFTRFQSKNHYNPSDNPRPSATIKECGAPGADANNCYSATLDDYFIIGYKTGLLQMAVDQNTGEINFTMLDQIIDTLADLYVATTVNGDPKTSPTADVAAQLIGVLLGEQIQSKNDPRFDPAARQVVAYLDRTATKANKDFMDSLEWIDTLRMYYRTFRFGNGI